MKQKFINSPMEGHFIMDNNKTKYGARRSAMVSIPNNVWQWMDEIHSEHGINKDEQLNGLIGQFVNSKSDLMKGVIDDALADAQRKVAMLEELEASIRKPEEKAKKVWVTPIPKVEEEETINIASETRLTRNITKETIAKAVVKNPQVNTQIKTELIKAIDGDLSISKDDVQITSKNEITHDWTHYAYKKYSDLDIIGSALKDSILLEDPNFKNGFKSGYYRWLHSQALALWKGNEDFTIKHLCKLQPIVDQTTGKSRTPQVQTMAKRLMKAIVHFGTAEEKKLLFGNSNIFPRTYTKKKK